MNNMLLAVSIAATAAILLVFLGPPIYEYLDEAARMKMIDDFKKFPIYEKFKSMYPNSTESFGLYYHPVLLVEQSDGRGNTLLLSIAKDAPPNSYYFSVRCGFYPFAMLEEAFDFLDNHDCFQDP